MYCSAGSVNSPFGARAVAEGVSRLHNTTPPHHHPQWDKPRQMAILAFFQRKPMFHRIVSALKFLAGTISISCASVQ